MKFKCFVGSSDYINSLNRDIQSFIDECEEKGMSLFDKTVNTEKRGNDSNLKPTIIITIWMK